MRKKFWLYGKRSIKRESKKNCKKYGKMQKKFHLLSEKAFKMKSF